MGWWRKPAPRYVRPEPSQLRDAVKLWQVALEIADGDDKRARQIAFRLLRARRFYRRLARSA